MQVWYMRPEWFAELSLGAYQGEILVDPNHLEKTHVHLLDTPEQDREKVFAQMQTENWSPNGEARPLIEERGLRHTIMTIGDVLVDDIGQVWLADMTGFSLLGVRYGIAYAV